MKHKRESLARRVLPALSLMGASGALLAALDHPAGSLDAAAPPPIPSGDASSTVTIVPTAGTTAPTTETAVAGVPATTAATTTEAATTATAAGVPATAAPVAGVPAANAPEVATPVAPVVTEAPTTVPPVVCGAAVVGPTVGTKYGPVQVQAALDSNGRVCAAHALVWPTEDGKSVRINDQAIPLLDQWAVYQGDTSFSSISGATITSRAYKESLQAIIDGRA